MSVMSASVRAQVEGSAIYGRFFHNIDCVERAINGVTRPEQKAGDRHHLAAAVTHEIAEDQRDPEVQQKRLMKQMGTKLESKDDDERPEQDCSPQPCVGFGEQPLAEKELGRHVGTKRRDEIER